MGASAVGLAAEHPWAGIGLTGAEPVRSSAVTARPGDFSLTRLDSEVRLLIRLGQWLCGQGFRDYEHAYLHLEGGWILEAEPGGAVIRRDHYPQAGVITSSWPLSNEQRAAIVAAARRHAGVGYSVLDYLSLALRRLHLRPAWLRRYLASTGRMTCGQLVDQIYSEAGLAMFNDGRFPGDVTPAALYTVLEGPSTPPPLPR
jgi:hypothetical protein